MAVQPAEDGFFTAQGVLRTESRQGSAQTAQNQTGTTISDQQVTDQARAATASQITDAAVVQVSARLNATGTGFDSGVSAFVNDAVTRGLAAQNRSGSAGSTVGAASRPVGGSYQNEILAGAKQAAQPAQQTPAPQPPTPPPQQPEPQTPAPHQPAQHAHQGHGQAHASEHARGKGLGGSYQNEILTAGKGKGHQA